MFKNLIVSSLFIFSASGLYATTAEVVLHKEARLSEQPLFGRDQYHLSKLNAGTKAEVVSVNTHHEGGASFQIKITEGPSKGQIGWIYLSSEESKRTFKVFDSSKKEIKFTDLKTKVTELNDDKVLSFLGTARRINNPPNTFKSSLNPVIQTMQRLPMGGVFSKSPQHVTFKTDKEIWDDFVEGKLKVDDKSYKSGKTITFIEEVKKNDGTVLKRDHVAAVLPEYIVKLPEAIQDALSTDPECKDDPNIFAAIPKKKTKQVKPGCEVLSGRVSANMKDKLSQCFDSIKNALRGDKKLKAADRAKVFKKFYTDLSQSEQEFLGHMVTSIGEAGVLAPPIEEMVAIMLILDNRKHYAIDKGFPNTNVLDAALQPWQFSMYNRGAHHWSDALNRPSDDEQTQNGLEAFISFKNLKITPKLREITHYHTNAVSPAWKAADKVVKLSLNGKALKDKGKRHIFYKDIAWSFQNNSWSNK